MRLQISDWRKILLFGAVGALGCFLASCLGEGLFIPYLPPPARPQVEVVFVLDTTKSMKGEIEGVRTGIQEFAHAITAHQFPIRLGLIAFRDHLSGEEPQALSFYGSPFTTDTTAFSAEVGKLKAASKGPNKSEGSLDAIALATRQPFDPEAIKVLVLITDAPPDIPDKEIKNVAEAAALVAEKKINQLHLVIYEEDRAVFSQLQAATPGQASTGAPGQVFLLGDIVAHRQDLRQLLTQVGEQIKKDALKGLGDPRPFSQKDFWSVMAVTAAWTGLLGFGVAVALVIGQNFYLRRRLLKAAEALSGGGGGLVAGLVAGAAGQLFFASVLSRFGFGYSEQIIAWTLLGGLLGIGVAKSVPNLTPIRAVLGGSVGGVLAACTFIGLTQTGLLGAEGVLAGSALSGRFAAAIALGFAIGAMIAVADLFREAWLEIQYHSGEKRSVALGLDPVGIGSDATACTIYAQGADPLAYRYKLQQGKIVCEDVVGQQTRQVQPGNQRKVGNLIVTVCGIAAQTPVKVPQIVPSPPPVKEPQIIPSPPASRFVLSLSSGQQIGLDEGVKVSTQDILGATATTGEIVAEVNHSPNDRTILGLKNLSQNDWLVITSGGSHHQVPSGKSIKLEKGTKINFGPVEGEVF